MNGTLRVFLATTLGVFVGLTLGFVLVPGAAGVGALFVGGVLSVAFAGGLYRVFERVGSGDAS